MKQKEPLKGKSYLLRCKKINEIYDKWVKIGLSTAKKYIDGLFIQKWAYLKEPFIRL